MEGTFLNSDVYGLAAFIIDIAAILFLISASAIVSISIAAGVIGLFGFGGRRDSILQQRGRGLEVWHSLGNDILGNGVSHNWRGNGRNLHRSGPSKAVQKTFKARISPKAISEMTYIIAYTE